MPISRATFGMSSDRERKAPLFVRGGFGSASESGACDDSLIGARRLLGDSRSRHGSGRCDFRCQSLREKQSSGEPQLSISPIPQADRSRYGSETPTPPTIVQIDHHARIVIALERAGGLEIHDRSDSR
jgi:hypothetical protein